MEMINNSNDIQLCSSFDLLAELSRRGYDVNAIHEKGEMNKRVTRLIDQIEWDNWVEEDGQAFKVGEVYWSRLEWAKGEQEDDEIVELLQDIQDTICPILNLLDNQ
jgi:hypothetical protein